MSLPFTETQFFDVLAGYNLVFWPFVAGLWLATLFSVIQLMRGKVGHKLLGSLLVVHWGWSGAVYHLGFFTRINPAAYGFAALFVAQAVLFAWYVFGRAPLRFDWGPTRRHALAAALLALSLIYPLLGVISGHPWPRVPAFAVPCPTLLFTAGLLLAVAAPVPRWLFVVPVLWAVIGGSAALVLGVTPDLLLFLAGIVMGLYALTSHAAWWQRPLTGGFGRRGRLRHA